MSRVAHLALAAAANTAGSCLLPPLLPTCLFYLEQNSGPCVYQRSHAKICIRARPHEPEDERHLVSHHYSRVKAVLLEGQP